MCQHDTASKLPWMAFGNSNISSDILFCWCTVPLRSGTVVYIPTDYASWVDKRTGVNWYFSTSFCGSVFMLVLLITGSSSELWSFLDLVLVGNCSFSWVPEMFLLDSDMILICLQCFYLCLSVANLLFVKGDLTWASWPDDLQRVW